MEVHWAYVELELWKTLGCLGAPKVQAHDFGFTWEGLRDNRPSYPFPLQTN